MSHKQPSSFLKTNGRLANFTILIHNNKAHVRLATIMFVYNIKVSSINPSHHRLLAHSRMPSWIIVLEWHYSFLVHFSLIFCLIPCSRVD